MFSALRTKNVREMLERLQQVPNVHIYLTTFEHPKAIELSEVSDLASESINRFIVAIRISRYIGKDDK